jgi:hypothetical protein
MYKKCCFKRFFNQKVKASTCFWFSNHLGVIFDSQVTTCNRSAAGGGGLSQGVLPGSCWSPVVTYDSQPHGYALFFKTIQIKVKPEGIQPQNFVLRKSL